MHFDSPRATEGDPTGRCMIIVTPDGERTLNTYLGASATLCPADLDLDLIRSGKVTVDGAAIKLTSHELRLLSYLMHHKGKVISRTELTEHLYDQDFDRDSNTIEVFVTRIRKKLGADVITTIRGLGYSLDEPGR